MHEKWDDPEVNWRVVRALLITSPFMFVGSYLLALVQRASHAHCLLIAGLCTGMALGAAAIIHLFKSQANAVFGAIAVVLGLLAALLTR